MKYEGKTKDGRTVTGNAVQYQGFDAWIVQKTPSGCSQTKVRPETVREIEAKE